MTTLPPGSASATRPPTTAELADPTHARAWKSAQDFESVALGALLGPMFETVDQASAPFGGGGGEAAWRPMLTQQLADRIAHGGGLGLAPMVYRQILRLQESPPAAPPGGERP